MKTGTLRKNQTDLHIHAKGTFSLMASFINREAMGEKFGEWDCKLRFSKNAINSYPEWRFWK